MFNDAFYRPLSRSSLLLYFLLSAILLGANQTLAQLTNGSESIANIDPIGDVDSWTVPVNAGETILLQVGERSSNGAFQPELRIIDPDGVVQANNWGNDSSGVVHRASQTGNYTLQLADDTSPGNGTAEYQLYYGKIPGSFIIPAGDEGGALTNGGIHPGTITLGDLDMWTIELEALDTFIVQVTEDSGSSFQPQLTLYSPIGDAVSNNWGNDSSALVYQAPVSGRYTVVVNDDSIHVDGIADYTLYATAINGSYAVEPGDEGGPLTNGGVHSGSIPRGDVDAWTLSLQTGDTLSASIAEVSGDAFQPELTLYDAEGRALSNNWGNDSTSIRHQVANAGDYTLIVRDDSGDADGSGDYLLYTTTTASVPVTPVGDEGGNVSSGDVISGVITEADIDSWMITANANDTVVIQVAEVTGTGFQPELTLYDPFGNALITDWGNEEAVLRLQLPVGGVYTLMLRDDSGDAAGSGEYLLHYVQVPATQTVAAGDEGGALSPGINNGIITSGDIDVWTFTADHADTVAAELIDTGATDLSPEFYLYDPEGNFLAGSWDYTSVSINAQLPIAGTYTLVVRDDGAQSDHTGNYTLDFDLTQNTTSVPSGSILATLTNGGRVDGLYEIENDIDKFHLPVTAGSKVVISLAERNGNSGSIVPWLQVFDSSGDLVAETIDGTQATTYFTATASETLTVVARNNGTGLDEYQMYYAVAAEPYSTAADDEGGLLVNGQRTTGVLPRGDLDLYSLAVTAGQPVRIKLAEASGNSGSVIPHLRVFSASGDLIHTAADGITAEVYFEAPASEQLLVLASNDGSGEMDYELNVSVGGQAYTTAAGDEGGALANGVWQTGILLRADLDLFDLPVMAGDTVSVRLGELGTANSGSIVLRLQVFGSDGTLYQTRTSGTHMEAVLIAGQSETLRVVVSNDQTASSADYELQASVASQAFTTVPADEGGALTPAASEFGTVSRGDLDMYAIAVTADTDISLSMIEQAGNSGSMVPELRIYRPNGSLMAFASDGVQADVTFRALATENLLVMAYNSASGTGDYELLVTAADTDPDGDLDGLTDSEEATAGTSPTNPDTDGDGMPDAFEIANGLNPLVDDSADDLDGDGISNLDEYLGGTDPAVSAVTGDANNDGIVDMGDVLVVQQHVLGITVLDSEAILSADLYPAGSPDGTLSVADLLLLLNQIME